VLALQAHKMSINNASSGGAQTRGDGGQEGGPDEGGGEGRGDTDIGAGDGAGPSRAGGATGEGGSSGLLGRSNDTASAPPGDEEAVAGLLAAELDSRTLVRFFQSV